MTRQRETPKIPRPWTLVTVVVAALEVTGSSWAAGPTDQELLEKVTKRLLACVDEPPAGLAWPPVLEVLANDQINAYAMVRPDGGKKWPSKVAVTRGLMRDVVQKDEDRLALVVGHEIAHLLLGHCRPPSDTETEFVRTTFSRDHEIAADLKGMELSLAAGYSLRGGVKGIQRMIELGLSYSSFEGLGVGHPSWKDRLAFLDKEQATLWRAASGFDTGAYFLLIEQYVAAERCFREVVKDFPGCHEGWTNLGYALLMQYCDALEPDDLRGFEVGQLLVGGFYRRPASLEAQVRGVNEEVWWEAVGALREALRLKPELTLAKANLGVAYLVRPSGRQLGPARRLLDDSAQLAEADKTLHPLARAAVLLNAGVADFSDGDPVEGKERLSRAEQIAKKYATSRGQSGAGPVFTSALRYNRATLIAAAKDVGERKGAVSLFERYLRTTSRSSAWWPLAYDRYAKLCDDLKEPAKAKKEFDTDARPGLRVVSGVTLPSGETVSLNAKLTDVRKALGAGSEVPVVRNTNLLRVRYPSRGVELLANESVLAICLTGTKAPPVEVRASGIGSMSVKLTVGMTKAELEKVLGDEEYDFQELEKSGRTYRFYPEVGLAVRIRQGAVEEIAVVQMPRR